MVRLRKAKSDCRVTATVKLPGRLAKAKRVTLTITDKGLATSRRTVRARFTTTLQTTAVKLDRLVVRSVRKDVCPTRATVTVVGATKKQRATKRNVAVRLTPTADCQVSTTVRLPMKLRKARAVTVAVQAAGLRKVMRTVRR